MHAGEAIAKVQAWLRFGTPVDLTTGEHAVRIEHERVREVPDGWLVPYNTIRALDGGDRLASLVPRPVLLVRENGELRRPDPEPGGLGPSVPVSFAGQEDWREILEPEFARSEVAYLGVPASAVLGWRKHDPAGGPTEEVRVNPGYRPGPERLGHPVMETPLEQLLGCLQVRRFSREHYLAGLLTATILIPVDPRTEQPLSSLWQENPRTLTVFSSSRRLPAGTVKWVRMDVLSFAAEFPGTGLAVNPGSIPSDSVTVEELTWARARWPAFRATRRVVEVRAEYSAPVVAMIEQIRAGTEGIDPSTGLRDAAEKARTAGFELSVEECQRFVLGRAWEQRNGVETGRIPSPGDDIDGQSWPEDLDANGLVAGYDAAGRVRPHVSASGKFFHQDTDGVRFAWHRVAGAFAGFAVGEALGSVVDSATWPEIKAKFGEEGIAEPVSDGRLGPLTRRLLFQTEGLLRALPARFGSAAPGRLMALGALLSRPAPAGPEGWLSHVPDFQDGRMEPAPVANDVTFLVLGMVAALCGGGPECDAATAAQVGRLLATGAGADEPTAEAAGVTAELFTGLFHSDAPPPQVVCRRVAEREGARGPAVAALAAAVRAHAEQIRPDPEELDGLGSGDTAVEVMGRAMIAVSRRFFDPRWAMRAAVNHSGRSGITGAFAGAVVGAWAGIPGLPQEWLGGLGSRGVVETVAGDAFWHFSARSPAEDERFADEWAKRYPRIWPSSG
ncbi:YrhB domain-containing protein [Amycolatopsis keratiniphila]|uniref:YrhB domain-containing protein n=1 Tax=Amycolatopsis keratiniphila TaxID=129921 RepID=UPI00039F8E24|nr:YrhB domain-containing protein [Amycolatopsis keratiniphila]